MNTMLVGLWEEWVFRGVLFQGLRSRLAPWTAILRTSALYCCATCATTRGWRWIDQVAPA
jgi:membrane protease YdiL (CAAX protease family)